MRERDREREGSRSECYLSGCTCVFAVGRRTETCMSLTLNLFAWLLFAVLCACYVAVVVLLMLLMLYNVLALLLLLLLLLGHTDFAVA